jgi:hypothetical protein
MLRLSPSILQKTFSSWAFLLLTGPVQQSIHDNREFGAGNLHEFGLQRSGHVGVFKECGKYFGGGGRKAIG